MPGSTIRAVALGLLLAGILAVLALAVPLIDCPFCEGGIWSILDEDDPSENTRPLPCPRCGEHHSLTVMERWFPERAAMRTDPPEPLPPSLESLSAEQAFSILENRLIDAGSARMKVRIVREASKDYGRWESDGTLLLRKHGQVCFLLRSLSDEVQYQHRAISDGTTLWWKSNRHGHALVRPIPEHFQRNVAAQVFRIGMQQTQAAPLDGGSAVVRVSDIRFAEAEPGLRALTWTLQVPEPGQYFASTLWFDGKTLRPVRRRLTTTIEQETLVLNEYYEEFRLNLDLPDRKFELPK